MFERLFFILFALISIANTKVLDQNSDKPPLLLLISFDGFRWDYLENYTLNNFQEYFIQNGVKVHTGLRNAFTTVTFPNHWTIATGLYPESHGIVANVIYDNELNETYYDFGPLDNKTEWFGQNQNAVPIWILNQLQGKESRRSGIMGAYPGSNVPIANTTAYVTFDYELESQLNWFRKVDMLVNWYMDDKNPINFGVLYFPEPDDTGHQFGPYSIEISKMIHNCDYVIGYLIQKLKMVGLYDQMNIIITSDHGMDTATEDHSLNLNEYVDISKFNSYGGLTQINIFPHDRKLTSSCLVKKRKLKFL
jgi:predicted AlkP superfamily pyrophosphatase or phosphodiesterase